jgi:hypothetical protein
VRVRENGAISLYARTHACACPGGEQETRRPCVGSSHAPHTRAYTLKVTACIEERHITNCLNKIVRPLPHMDRGASKPCLSSQPARSLLMRLPHSFRRLLVWVHAICNPSRSQVPMMVYSPTIPPSIFSPAAAVN